MSVLINVGFCASHRKGAHDGNALPAADHWEWLEKSASWWWKNFHSMVVVSATAYAGPLHVEAGRARDALWRVIDNVDFLGDSSNPSHQLGAGITVRLGLEYAGKLGYDRMVHTAEDVLPRPGVVEAMLKALEAGDEYAGDAWGVGTPAEGLNACFWACRVPYLAGVFDPGAIPAAGHIEGHLRDLLRGKRLSLWQGGPGARYRHTHDPAEWRRWAEEQK